VVVNLVIAAKSEFQIPSTQKDQRHRKKNDCSLSRAEALQQHFVNEHLVPEKYPSATQGINGVIRRLIQLQSWTFLPYLAHSPYLNLVHDLEVPTNAA